MFKFPSGPGAVAILKPRAPTVVLQRLVQVSQRSTCKLNYKVAIPAPRVLILLFRFLSAAAILAPRALIPTLWAPNVVLEGIPKPRAPTVVLQ